MCREEKILVGHNKLFNYFFKKIQKQPPEVQKQSPEVFCKKKVFLKISRKFHRKTPVLESFFNKVAGLQLFPVKFAKLLETPILKNICKRLLLEVFYNKVALKNFAILTGRK